MGDGFVKQQALGALLGAVALGARGPTGVFAGAARAGSGSDRTASVRASLVIAAKPNASPRQGKPLRPYGIRDAGEAIAGEACVERSPHIQVAEAQHLRTFQVAASLCGWFPRPHPTANAQNSGTTAPIATAKVLPIEDQGDSKNRTCAGLTRLANQIL